MSQVGEVRRTGDGVTLTWRYTYVSLWLYAAYGYVGLALNVVVVRGGWARSVLLGLVLVGCLVACGRVMRFLKEGLGQDRQPDRERIAVLGLGLVGVAIGSWAPPFAIGVCLLPWVVAAFQAADLPAPRRWWWLAGVAVAALAVRYAVGMLSGARASVIQPFDTPLGLGGAALFTLMVPVLIVFQVWLWDLVLRVRSSGETDAELARVRERLRIAADLHDVQGHHLQVIALKTELAERLVGRDPDAARQQLREAQQVARQAIAETRDIVRGYRAVPLRDEAANAASVLEASGAACVIDVDDRGHALPLLASLLREATTNILRHSAATRVEIDLAHGAGPGSCATLRITNDGVAGAAAPVDGPAAGPRMGPEGSGLSGLEQRFVLAGGTLTSGIEDDRFVVVGRVPDPQQEES